MVQHHILVSFFHVPNSPPPFPSFPHPLSPSLVVGIDQTYSNFAYKPEGGYLLTFKNQDKPGALLQVLDLLHVANVNIANLNVVRAQQSTAVAERPAVTFMSLDNDIPTKIMNQIRNLSNLEDVAKIRLI